MSETLRGVVAILLTGVVLGVAFNALGLKSRPAHGLPWVRTPAKVERLEDYRPAGGTAGPEARGTEPAQSQLAPAPPPAAQPAAAGAPEKAQPRPAATKTELQRPAPSKGTPSSPTAPTTSDPTAGHAGAAGAAPAPGQPTASDAAALHAGLPEIPDVDRPLDVTLATLKRFYDAGAALIVDARDGDEFADGHIAGALNLPYNDALADPSRVQRLDAQGRPIVVYCSGGDCELSHDLAKVLIEAGKRKVLTYSGGYPEWQAAGYPVERGAGAGGS